MAEIPVPIDTAPSGTDRVTQLKRWLLASIMSLLAAGIVGLIVVQSPDADPSPADELARAQRFVQRTGSAHFEATQESVEKDGEDGLGSTYTDRSRAVGVLEVAGRSQWIEEDGTFAIETLVLDDSVYYREADTRDELGREQWAFTPRSSAVGAAGPIEEGDFASASMTMGAMDASHVIELLRAARKPTRVRAGVIRAEVDVTKLEGFNDAFAFDDVDIPLPKMTVEIHSAPDGRLDQLSVETRMQYPMFDDEEADEATRDATSVTNTIIRFSRWGDPVGIAAPARSDVDPTPGIDEEAVAAFGATPLLAPRAIPNGFQLLSADVIDGDVEDGECPEVGLEYGDGRLMDAYFADAGEEAAYPATLSVTLTPVSCEDFYGAIDEADASPIRLGRRSGQIVRGDVSDEEFGLSIEVIVGATRVNIDSDLPENVVVAAASDLVPFDIAAQPVHRVEPPQ